MNGRSGGTEDNTCRFVVLRLALRHLTEPRERVAAEKAYGIRKNVLLTG